MCICVPYFLCSESHTFRVHQMSLLCVHRLLACWPGCGASGNLGLMPEALLVSYSGRAGRGKKKKDLSGKSGKPEITGGIRQKIENSSGKMYRGGSHLSSVEHRSRGSAFKRP